MVTHFKNLAENAARFGMSDHFGTLCIKGVFNVKANTRDQKYFHKLSYIWESGFVSEFKHESRIQVNSKKK